jgi:hypothetical protein
MQPGIPYTVGAKIFNEGPYPDRIIVMSYPCGDGVEYFHSSSPYRRRRNGESRMWDSKICSRVPRDSDPRITALARSSRNYKGQTRPLVREDASHQQSRNYRTVIRIWSLAPDGCSSFHETGRLKVGTNIRLRLRKERASSTSLCATFNLQPAAFES